MTSTRAVSSSVTPGERTLLRRLPARERGPHFELEPGPDAPLQRLRHRLVEVAQDAHRKLRVDALLADEVVQRVRQREPDAGARPTVSQH